MSSNLPAPGLGALDETRQCEQLVSGERCVLVLNHRGACVKPVPRRDMSDVIRYRLLADKYAVAQETIDAQAARLAAVEQQLCDWQDHLRRVHHTLCDFPFRTDLPDDYKEEESCVQS